MISIWNRISNDEIKRKLGMKGTLFQDTKTVCLVRHMSRGWGMRDLQRMQEFLPTVKSEEQENLEKKAYRITIKHQTP